MSGCSVELYIREIIKAERITEEEIATLPALRQKRIRSVKHDQVKAELFTSGILLRDILGVSKDEDLFFSELGKPFLRSGKCFFSLSHDENYAVLATAPVPVGADVEEKKELSEPLRKRVFTEEERAVLDEDPVRNGIVLWTRLEAALKLSGEGVAGLDHRTFSLLEDGGSRHFLSLDHGSSVISIACGERFELRMAKRKEPGLAGMIRL